MNNRTYGELKNALGKLQLTSIIRHLKVELHPSGQREVEIITRCADDTRFVKGDSVLLFRKTTDLKSFKF